MSGDEPYVPEVGHRIRISYEGTVTNKASSGMVQLDNYRYLPSRWPAAVERLPDPEPQWEPGDLVLDDDGNLFRYIVRDDRDGFKLMLNGSGGTDYFSTWLYSRDALGGRLRRARIEVDDG